MRNLLIAVLAAATLIPSAAMAQPGHHPDSRVVVVDRHPGPAAHRPVVVQKRIVVGNRVETVYLGRSYVVAQPARYRLPRAGANQRWVRVRDDAVLVNLRTNRVIAVRYNIFR